MNSLLKSKCIELKVGSREEDISGEVRYYGFTFEVGE